MVKIGTDKMQSFPYVKKVSRTQQQWFKLLYLTITLRAPKPNFGHGIIICHEMEKKQTAVAPGSEQTSITAKTMHILFFREKLN